MGRLVELALDRGVLAVAVPGDQVDAGVRFAVAVRPVDPAPHLRVLLGEHRVELEVADHQLLELRAPLGVRRLRSERLDHLVQRRHSANLAGWRRGLERSARAVRRLGDTRRTPGAVLRRRVSAHGRLLVVEQAEVPESLAV